MKKNLVTSLILFLSLIPGICSAQSALEVDFEETPLFSETGIVPGETITKWVEVTNNTSESEPIATEAINFPGFPDPGSVPPDDLSRALDLVIREQGGSDLYGGSGGAKTLFDFYNDGETYLSDLGAGSSQTYEFEITFPSEKSNQWQGKTTGFDILIGFQGGEGTTDNTTEASSGGGGAPLRGLTITDEADEVLDPETCTIQVTWFTNYFSSSQVIYSSEGGNRTLDLGAPNYGYDFSQEGDDSGQEKVTSHSVTLEGLTPGTTYYYRCVSHGSLSVSREGSFETSCCSEPPAEPEENPGSEGEEEPLVFNPPASEGGNQIEAQEEPSEENPSEPPETPESSPEPEEEKGGDNDNEEIKTTSEGEQAALNAFLADIGEFFSGFFGGQTCFPCWLILILFAYSLYRMKKAESGKKKKIWLGWSVVLLSVAILVRVMAGYCVPGWILLLLLFVTFLVQRFNNKKPTPDLE